MIHFLKRIDTNYQVLCSFLEKLRTREIVVNNPDPINGVFSHNYDKPTLIVGQASAQFIFDNEQYQAHFIQRVHIVPGSLVFFIFVLFLLVPVTT